MKRTLPVALALAFAGATFLAACDQNNANRPAGTGGTASSPSSPSGAGSTSPDQTKKPGSPAPTSPSGSGSTGSGAKP
jgi:hypothetical protein